MAVRVVSLWLSVSQASNGTDDSLLRALHGGGSPPTSGLMIQPSSIPMLSSCFNKLFSMLQVHHVQVSTHKYKCKRQNTSQVVVFPGGTTIALSHVKFPTSDKAQAMPT